MKLSFYLKYMQCCLACIYVLSRILMNGNLFLNKYAHFYYLIGQFVPTLHICCLWSFKILLILMKIRRTFLFCARTGSFIQGNPDLINSSTLLLLSYMKHDHGYLTEARPCVFLTSLYFVTKQTEVNVFVAVVSYCRYNYK